jgi:hypothetical protein
MLIGKGNLKTDIKETGCESVNWIHLAQDMNGFWLLLSL